MGTAAQNLFDIVPPEDHGPALIEDDGSVQGWTPQQAEAAIAKLEAQVKDGHSKIAWQENVIKDLSIQNLDKDFRLDQLQSQIRKLKMALQEARQGPGDPQSLQQ